MEVRRLLRKVGLLKEDVAENRELLEDGRLQLAAAQRKQEEHERKLAALQAEADLLRRTKQANGS